MYIITTLNQLKAGQYFQFYTGATINLVVFKEHNLIVYQNILTNKNRRITGFSNSDKETKLCKIRYCKDLNNMFNSYYANIFFHETSIF